MLPLRFLSQDRSTAVVIDASAAAAIEEMCLAAGSNETGGILIGNYSRWGDTATVMEATDPPPDSRRGPRGFWRGVRGLRALLADRWRRQRLYYIGEWHFHPYAPSTPSPQDRKQIFEFAQDGRYRCPRPVLLIVGGDSAADVAIETWVVSAPDLLRLEIDHVDS